ncbi:uncharacterized protein N7443_007116 [Penicillium atrosanguineum]|uniref:uncharacterized protein n=1 Tax=Penicillium atrosanguineum TaxID=1132637 RepID=UPI0023A641B0|nr:uncharacterized protein N7443_007116 [Penicillium atrosanguineum]KAJ5296223.1 hypothetical protein N7443_007116 [Penicillium atrosanguineum]
MANSQHLISLKLGTPNTAEFDMVLQYDLVIVNAVANGKICALVDSFTNEELAGAELIDAEYVEPSSLRKKKKPFV